MKAALVFSQYGPYHFARAAALENLMGDKNFVGLQIAAESKTYAWKPSATLSFNLVTLCKGIEEDASFFDVFAASWRIWRREQIKIAFLPSYAPSTSLALLISAKLAGVKCVMMNESHAGTERARGIKKSIKRFLVSLFDGAIVGGEPQRRHFVSLGMKPSKIVTGYDAIDNQHFSLAAATAREHAGERRQALGLPGRYILSLGRMVKKKNLSVLIDAYAAAKRSGTQAEVKLVFVGSGDCQDELIARCVRHQLGYSLTPLENGPDSDVLFYGFRQIDENPTFYALAEMFVLPSLYEEWGLVVNEAMACGLPVLVSSTVGSAEDLVIPGVNGFHFDPTSSEQLAKHISYLLESPHRGIEMGRSSNERIRDWGCDNFARNAKLIASRIS